MLEELRFCVRDESQGQRIDLFLAQKESEFSRSQISDFISRGFIQVDGIARKASYKLKSGESVTMTVPPLPPNTLIPEDIPISVLYEDDDVLVLDKPAGMVVHPAAGHHSGTLVNALLKLIPDISGVGEQGRPGIVHRLDKDTSGVMMVAKNVQAHRYLSKQIKDREISKVYIALVKGNLASDKGIITGNIARDIHNRKRMSIVESGRISETSYETMNKYRLHTLVKAFPKTGRTHQIRVHFSSIGHPIVGDSLYGGGYKGLSRHFLHSNRLGFRIPSTKEYIEIESKLAPDLNSFLGNLNLENV
jgi:23S rRNA pseudouridine1911/1915/1917 synthase